MSGFNVPIVIDLLLNLDEQGGFKMPESEFAKILVEEIINKRFDVKKLHHL